MNGIGNKKSLLCICIPTYNRAEILEESLAHLMERVKGWDVQVVVLDNASTDSTPEKVRQYCDEIIYIRNDKNIGGDMNILKAYQIASQLSDYVCVLGDSYRFESALDDLMDILATRDLNLVIISRDYGNIAISESRYYNDADELLRDLGGMMDLVGCIVVKQEAVIEQNYTPYIWGNFIHCGMVFHYLSSLGTIKCYYLKEQCLYHTSIDKIKTSWYRNLFEIFAKNWMLTILSLPGGTYSIENKLICVKRHDYYTGCFSLRSLLFLRAKRCIFYGDVRKYKNYIPFVACRSFYSICLVSLFPKWILLIMYSLKRMIRIC